ncbi:protein TIC110 chloroplastic-like [Trifolium medium]|uniref:Protein TIC110 chloroplastic-like n=1 Tax=Trifolium medium TaxID=97028 RepID=A0A392N2L5_9FABA|nr:protein TIC110 chloroplastic-like [Trifolium medium]
MADSKAAFLQNLCDELHFDPLKASELHEEIYRQKLQQCVADGELNDEDVAALLKLRVMLCVPQQTVEAAHADICGSLFEKCLSTWHVDRDLGVMGCPSPSSSSMGCLME